ncbi:hypothetical protein [Natranaerobius thermophilus]|uniref:Uncharacterized protein n=1 Tax=Natranaerobius thermophilus (strain ATCC BAA-1301 / DSM 18059 / JW/NM-WN-LF) TaxID=457570 RepID=B2A3Z6_NATTJ|nr:hypothetical protein [Natranaerobius thermophilus]ACB85098.1 hypothetical protein Nther_1517 [Natranaerobius thermophilus JW/NM-WN-LF]
MPNSSSKQLKERYLEELIEEYVFQKEPRMGTRQKIIEVLYDDEKEN